MKKLTILKNGYSVVKDYEVKGWTLVYEEGSRYKHSWALAKDEEFITISYNGLYRITTVKEGLN